MYATLWHIIRALRWAAWIGFFLWSAIFAWDCVPHLNSYGHVALYGVLFFGLANFAVVCGMLELMMRERAGRPRSGGPASLSPVR